MWVSQYSEKRVNAEKKVEVWPTQRKRTESREPDQVRRSVVSGAVDVFNDVGLFIGPIHVLNGAVILAQNQQLLTTRCSGSVRINRQVWVVPEATDTVETVDGFVLPTGAATLGPKRAEISCYFCFMYMFMCMCIEKHSFLREIF